MYQKIAHCCKGCAAENNSSAGEATWWRLSNYHGITGLFCPDCYDKISHDSYGRPERPADYLLMRMKLSS